MKICTYLLMKFFSKECKLLKQYHVIKHNINKRRSEGNGHSCEKIAKRGKRKYPRND